MGSVFDVVTNVEIWGEQLELAYDEEWEGDPSGFDGTLTDLDIRSSDDYSKIFLHFRIIVTNLFP